MNSWIKDSIFYHVYPLGFCGAPPVNDFTSDPVQRLDKMSAWIERFKEIGSNAVYLGPVFESATHGYDTVDYFRIDRRLGDNDSFKRLAGRFHEDGIRVVLDGVFNHVGRDFWAFRNVRERLTDSPYADWFSGLDFHKRSPYGDPFTYDCWNGHYNLVKLNLSNLDVKNHLFQAVRTWIEDFQIDGLRLDAADCLDFRFIAELADFCKSIKADFWLMGEVIHGDYRKWVDAGLDSVTNYESYKGLYSSHNDANYFEIAYSLNRQFGEHGIYKGMLLYSFADNHDVERVASVIRNKAHLYPLYCLLYSMPGVPSIYYGSEWGIEGRKTGGSDENLRPSAEWVEKSAGGAEAGLRAVLARLARIRNSSSALKVGDYRQILVHHRQFVFARCAAGECVIVAVNSADQPIELEVNWPFRDTGHLVDLLNEGDTLSLSSGKLKIKLWPNWGRILKFV